MSATEVVANMPLHSATVRVNKHKADWRGWKFMWPFALVFVFVFVFMLMVMVMMMFVVMIVTAALVLIVIVMDVL